MDLNQAKKRCAHYRLRILEMSQKVPALHIAPAFSCVEITDLVYHELLRKDAKGAFQDTFLMSKGHGCITQYIILNELGFLTDEDILNYCKPNGKLGAHPDYGIPGIAAATGSLGHGLGIATGMAYADKLNEEDRKTYVLISDGELQEGSTWEAMMMSANLKLDNLIVFVDLNDFGGLEKMSQGHPAFYPLVDKLEAFGCRVFEANGHNSQELFDVAARPPQKNLPTVIVAHTVKGKGVSYMENVAIWHYRSPNLEEYKQALEEILKS